MTQQELNSKTELNEAELDQVTGGALSRRGMNMWTCPYCGETLILSNTREAEAHTAQCPQRPW